MDSEVDYEARIDAADLERKARKERRPDIKRNVKHVCKIHTIKDDKTVCVYCGNEMEL